jgi:hypothetical protein
MHLLQRRAASRHRRSNAPRELRTPAQQSASSELSTPAQQPASSHAATVQEADIFGKIERLADLQKKGILSSEEFATKKAELLSRL